MAKPKKEYSHDYITMYPSGIKFEFSHPKPRMFCLADVCHVLAFKPRFSGNTKRPYSVGEHLLTCAHIATDIFGKEIAKEAFIHDFAETYYMDIPTPIKAAFGKRYIVLESFWQGEINKMLLGYQEFKYYNIVHDIDVRIRNTEASQLTGCDPWWKPNEMYDIKIGPERHWTAIRDQLIATCKGLLGEDLTTKFLHFATP